DLLTINMLWELEDINLATNVASMANFSLMSAREVSLYVRQRTHCSSIVKLLHDGARRSELFTGHNSWMGYHMMLRVFKRYEFGGLRPVAMTSYPGALVSGDDWFQVGNLTITETTLPNYNNEIFAAVTPKTVPYWIRAMVANQQARSGPDWMEVFAKHNSGTYNNMWIVVDYSKFEPYKPVREGLLTVGEQLPDFFYYEDQTAVLSYGYYPSYNAAAYPETARLIKQDKMAREKGEDFSYQMVSRAKVFRRDQADIRSDADMQRTMQYNQFKTDPLAKGDPCNQLACRADLDKDAAARQTFGAIDAKYTSSAHVRADRTLVISGPTKDDQPVFDWRAVDPALAAKSSHNGQPERFNFPWM
ncbi:hypothetical protein EMIHUDRAFT_41599, partial [Emiliania huxleyi CCMP1516]|uniref:Phospholipase B-like n=2 Tax=Emiliania huxleyi TaxID=2903 RepID=A0A0D3KZK8_EMIH1